MKELNDIIKKYGEEPFSSRIANAIVENRKIRPIETTHELSSIVNQAVPRKKTSNPNPILSNPSTKTFQALRIYVNDELEELKKGLIAAEHLLRPGGKIIIICFHLLEIKTVRDFFRVCTKGQDKKILPSFERSHKITPSNEEIKGNPRSRTSLLFHSTRTGHPPVNTP